VDGKLVHRFATISRVKRTGAGRLHGYQRPEALSHIEAIRDYLESPSPLLPNAVVLAFDSRVRFEATEDTAGESEYASAGVLVIPLETIGEHEKPGFIVDGQQRLAAIRDAHVEHFPVAAVAFITDDMSEQTEQFLLVNSTKPLSKALIYELLPTTTAQLPAVFQRRRLPAQLLERLNLDSGSPLHGMIQTATNPTGIIKDNSILKMLENSLIDGALHHFREDSELDGMLSLLRNYWTAVSHVFHASWALTPKKSRLMHGAGIVSLGLVMDSICGRFNGTGTPSVQYFEHELRPLAEVCHWTAGTWDFGNGQRRKWNELQNTSKDLRLLALYLDSQYRDLVSRTPAKPERAARR
jgi:DGQHR domain-containing protein